MTFGGLHNRNFCCIINLTFGVLHNPIFGVLHNLDFCCVINLTFGLLHNAIIVQSKTGLNRFQAVKENLHYRPSKPTSNFNSRQRNCKVSLCFIEFIPINQNIVNRV